MNNVFKFLIPKPLYLFLSKIRRSYFYNRFRFMSTENIFTTIYNQRLWGSTFDDFQYCSGWGSHDSEIINPYVDNVQILLKSLNKLSVVDLGCGDFNVGVNFIGYFEKYTACDIVSPLIESNIKRFNKFDVNFLHLNIITDDLPIGDLAILRQVLQHLTNAEIEIILSKLNIYKYLLITEHVSNHTDYKPNLDHPTGFSTRVDINSGVDIEAAPFSFDYLSVNNIISVNVSDGKITTKLYTLN